MKIYLLLIAVFATIALTAPPSASPPAPATDVLTPPVNASTESTQWLFRRLGVGLGHSKQNIGDWKGNALYEEVWRAVDYLIATDPRPIDYYISTKYLTDGPRAYLRTGKNRVTVEYAEWKNEAVRHLLIGTVAAAVLGMTEAKENC